MKTIYILTLTAIVATASFLGVAHADTKAKGKDIVAVASSAGSNGAGEGNRTLFYMVV